MAGKGSAPEGEDLSEGSLSSFRLNEANQRRDAQLEQLAAGQSAQQAQMNKMVDMLSNLVAKSVTGGGQQGRSGGAASGPADRGRSGGAPQIGESSRPVEGAAAADGGTRARENESSERSSEELERSQVAPAAVGPTFGQGMGGDDRGYAPPGEYPPGVGYAVEAGFGGSSGGPFYGRPRLQKFNQPVFNGKKKGFLFFLMRCS